MSPTPGIYMLFNRISKSKYPLTSGKALSCEETHTTQSLLEGFCPYDV